MRIAIVSGGQTGVDRAALDVARSLGLPCAGWCPAGRAAEDGPLPARHPLRETPSADPAQRTAWNVRDSDATLVLSFGAPRGGTARALAEAARLGRPALELRLDGSPQGGPDPGAVREWLARHAVERLNVAGPRESEEPGVGEAAAAFLRRLLGEGDEGG
jgi:hypothetical protein